MKVSPSKRHSRARLPLRAVLWALAAAVGVGIVGRVWADYGVRGAVGYVPVAGATQLGEGFVNEVQRDTGIFFSTASSTALLATPLTDLTPTGPQTKPAVFWNLWAHRQLDAFGTAASLFGNGGNGNAPVVSTDSGATWAGVGGAVQNTSVATSAGYASTVQAETPATPRRRTTRGHNCGTSVPRA